MIQDRTLTAILTKSKLHMRQMYQVNHHHAHRYGPSSSNNKKMASLNELWNTPGFKRFLIMTTSVFIGACTPIVYKGYVDFKNMPGKTFYLYRRKLLESDPNDLEDPLQDDQCLEQRKKSRTSIIVGEFNLEYSSKCHFALHILTWIRNVNTCIAGMLRWIGTVQVLLFETNQKLKTRQGFGYLSKI